MASLQRLPDLDPGVREKLSANEIESSEDLWRAIGTHFEKGLTKVAKDTGVSEDILAHILAVSAGEKPPRLAPGEVILGLLLLALAGLGLLRIAEASGTLSFPGRLAVSSEQVVTAAGLPAFHVLGPGDVELRERPRTGKGLRRLDDALGKYLLRPVRPGQVLREDQLSSVRLSPGDLAGRRIFTLRLAPGPLPAGVEPGRRSLLILSPKKEPGPAVEADVLVLDLQEAEGATAATVAVDPSKGATLAAALGSSEAVLATTAPSPPPPPPARSASPAAPPAGGPRS